MTEKIFPLDLLRQGVERWNSWKMEQIDIQPELDEADLSQADLSGADLRDVSLIGTN